MNFGANKIYKWTSTTIALAPQLFDLRVGTPTFGENDFPNFRGVGAFRRKGKFPIFFNPSLKRISSQVELAIGLLLIPWKKIGLKIKMPQLSEKSQMVLELYCVFNIIPIT